MGITVNDFFEYVHSIIFSPKAFFENDDLKISIRLAIGTVIFVVIISKVASSVLDGSILDLTFLSSLLFSIFGTVIVWFLTALFFEYVAKIFSADGNLQKILFYTAFAQIPYIFFAPLNLIKQAGSIGYLFGSLTEFFLYMWIIVLYAYSIHFAYKISIPRAFMLISLPFISAFFIIYWLVCFFSKIGYIFSV